MIMKGKAGEERYFKWYELAVQKDLKITKLYECYIETDESELSWNVAENDSDVFWIQQYPE